MSAELDKAAMAMSQEIRSHDTDISYVMDPLNAFRLVSMLQLAIRHPHLPAGHVQLARDMLESAEQYFAGCPTVLKAIAAGYDRAQDQPMGDA